ncbi:MAG: DinB family protein [Nannocystaceae bacterium]
MLDHALDYLRAGAYNNAWANHRLLAACARLDHAAFVAPRAGFFPSLQRTLNHLLIVDHYYVDALEGGDLGPAAWADRVPCPGVSALRAAQVAVDRRLIAVCESLTPATLGRATRMRRADHVQVERADRVLLHLFQHQVHHRGQAHAMLSATSVAPPQLDEFYPAEDAPLRVGDLAELGVDEATIWRSIAAVDPG